MIVQRVEAGQCTAVRFTTTEVSQDNEFYTEMTKIQCELTFYYSRYSELTSLAIATYHLFIKLKVGWH